MKKYTEDILKEFTKNYPMMNDLQEDLEKLIKEVVNRIKLGGKILICGNGGSAADSEHIVGELVKEFYIKRPIEEKFKQKLQDLVPEQDAKHITESLQGGIPAISLVAQIGFLTAYGNDVSFDMAYAQQVYVYGQKNDVFIGLSTSGNAENVCNAAKIAKAKGLLVISLTGETGGKLKEFSDILLNAPAQETFMVQEYHLPLYHLICRSLEYEIFGEDICSY